MGFGPWDGLVRMQTQVNSRGQVCRGLGQPRGKIGARKCWGQGSSGSVILGKLSERVGAGRIDTSFGRDMNFRSGLLVGFLFGQGG